MKRELWQLELSELEALHREEERNLERKLLAGAAWKDVAEERKRVGELLTLIYKKSNPKHFGDPAGYSQRQAPR